MGQPKVTIIFSLLYNGTVKPRRICVYSAYFCTHTSFWLITFNVNIFKKYNFTYFLHKISGDLERLAPLRDVLLPF